VGDHARVTGADIGATEPERLLDELCKFTFTAQFQQNNAIPQSAQCSYL